MQRRKMQLQLRKLQSQNAATHTTVVKRRGPNRNGKITTLFTLLPIETQRTQVSHDIVVLLLNPVVYVATCIVFASLFFSSRRILIVRNVWR